MNDGQRVTRYADGGERFRDVESEVDDSRWESRIFSPRRCERPNAIPGVDENFIAALPVGPRSVGAVAGVAGVEGNERRRGMRV